MREQAERYGATILADRIETIDVKADDFEAQGSTWTIAALAGLIATVVGNRRPALDADTHRDALQRGMLRYCPVCDGYEASGQAIGVIGANTHGVAEALFLRTFSERITLVAQETIDLGPDDRAALAARSEEHTSELQSLMRISYAVFCLKKKNQKTTTPRLDQH